MFRELVLQFIGSIVKNTVNQNTGIPDKLPSECLLNVNDEMCEFQRIQSKKDSRYLWLCQKGYTFNWSFCSWKTGIAEWQPSNDNELEPTQVAVRQLAMSLLVLHTERDETSSEPVPGLLILTTFLSRNPGISSYYVLYMISFTTSASLYPHRYRPTCCRFPTISNFPTVTIHGHPPPQQPPKLLQLPTPPPLLPHCISLAGLGIVHVTWSIQ
jgi:hypothetical protein